MVMLRGNTHPMARVEFDRGAAPDSLPMENMQLVLEAQPGAGCRARDALREQQDRTSPNYHKWVTPEEFGARFGPSDHDVQADHIVAAVARIPMVECRPGRTMVQFSGTAVQVQEAHFTPRFTVMWWMEKTTGRTRAILKFPSALAGIVAGVNTMNSSRKKPMSHVAGAFRRSNATGQVTPIKSQFTFSGSCGSSPCFAVAPFDFATIYNVLAAVECGNRRHRVNDRGL